VSALRDPPGYPREVHLRAGQAAKPDLHPVAGPSRALEQFSDGASAEGCLESVVAPLCDGLLEQRPPDLPSLPVGQFS
jgi:hypothetical protein